MPCPPRRTEPHGFNPDDWVSRANKRTQGVPFIAYAVAAAQLALADAHLEGWAALYDQARAGVAVGSGIGAIDEIAAAGELLGEHGKGPGKLSPFFVPRVLVNMAAGAISQNHALRGPQIAPATACATGACAVGDAFRAIKYGEADLMLAGGTESTINRVAIAGFARYVAQEAGLATSARASLCTHATTCMCSRLLLQSQGPLYQVECRA